TRPVAAAYAPARTIDAASLLPISSAISFAATLTTVEIVGSGLLEQTSVLTTTILPDVSFARIGGANWSCITIADHACPTVGGASTGPSEMTTVASVFPPRIMPP